MITTRVSRETYMYCKKLLHSSSNWHFNSVGRRDLLLRLSSKFTRPHPVASPPFPLRPFNHQSVLTNFSVYLTIGLPVARRRATVRSHFLRSDHHSPALSLVSLVLIQTRFTLIFIYSSCILQIFARISIR